MESTASTHSQFNTHTMCLWLSACWRVRGNGTGFSVGFSQRGPWLAAQRLQLLQQEDESICTVSGQDVNQIKLVSSFTLSRQWRVKRRHGVCRLLAAADGFPRCTWREMLAKAKKKKEAELENQLQPNAYLVKLAWASAKVKGHSYIFSLISFPRSSGICRDRKSVV